METKHKRSVLLIKITKKLVKMFSGIQRIDNQRIIKGIFIDMSKFPENLEKTISSQLPFVFRNLRKTKFEKTESWFFREITFVLIKILK